MSEPKKSTTAKTIIDVEHPGKSAPADTSRSIITHRPILKDPMVVDTEAPADPEIADKPELKSSSKPKLRFKNAEPEDQPVVATKSEPETEPEPEPEPATKDKAEAEPDAKDQTETEIEDEAAKQTEHEAQIQKIVDSKKYFLPINSVEKRRSARFVGLGIVLSLLLAVTWVDVALDAGLIHLGNIKPVTHFFSN